MIVLSIPWFLPQALITISDWAEQVKADIADNNNK
jgi:hypothetical protein